MEIRATASVVVGAAIIGPDGVLAQQRNRPPEHAGRWEFPGGRVEPDENERQAVARECKEELGVDVRVGERIGPDVVLSNGWLLRVYRAETVGSQQPRALEHRAVRWVPVDELDGLDWLAADRAVLPAVHALLVANREVNSSNG